MLRLASLAVLVAIWALDAHFAGPQLLPSPLVVGRLMAHDTLSGELPHQMLITLFRVVVAFGVAMVLGSALGIAMGRHPAFDRIADPWVVVLLNLPALVIIVLAYIWAGLTETAAISAVALNKLPNAAVTLREGARALDRGLDDMAAVYVLTPWERLRHVVLPQLAPYFAAATRSGLSLVWKIVLVVELLGRPNGIGFELGTAFQLFDVARILAYGLAFVAVMLVIESFIVRPFEAYAARWRVQRD